MSLLLEVPVIHDYKVKGHRLMNISNEALIAAVARYASAFTFEHLLTERGLAITPPDVSEIIECDDPSGYHGRGANQALFDAYLSTASVLRTTSADAHTALLESITMALFGALDPYDLYPASIGAEQWAELVAWMAFVRGAVEAPSDDLLLAGVIIERRLREASGNLGGEDSAV